MEYPIITWKNIDGRQVPFTKPQHQTSDGGYVESGERNPFPSVDKTATQAINDLKAVIEAQTDNVTVDNFPSVQDVIVKNPQADVEINNLPTDYPDSAVKTELQAIKQTQSDIISALQATNETLQGTLNTQLTGSNVEDGIPTINIGNSKGIVLADKEQIMSGSSKTFATLSRENELLGAKKISFYVSSDQKCKAYAYFYSYATDELVRNSIEITAETSTILARPSFLTMEVPVTKRVAVIVTNFSDSDTVCNVSLGISW